VATHFGAAAAALGWMLAEVDALNGKPSVLGGISGAVAGLVAITPASGFVQPFPALLIGACAGVVCYFMVVAVKGSSATTTRWTPSASTAWAARWAPAHRRFRHQRWSTTVSKTQSRHVLPLGLVDGKAGAGAEPDDRLRHRGCSPSSVRS
jgi:ammonium transporter, Amt family